LYAIHLYRLVEVYDRDFGHRLFKLLSCEELSTGVLLVHAQDVFHHGVKDALGCVRHVYETAEGSAGDEECNSGAVVQVEVSDESDIDVREVVII
jgi:hypothetical protein